MGFWQEVRSDCSRYRAAGAHGWLGVVLLHQGFWASAHYRWARWLLWTRRVPVVRQLARLSLLLTGKAVELTTGVCLPTECRIGPGLYIGHFGPTILGPGVRLGSNCNLSQGVTLGLAGRGDRRGEPSLGDRVYVGANAVVIGAITVGDDVAIGAGAVVTRSVPDRAVVVGNPARVISYAGSFDFVRYPGMETDPERLASLAARPAEATCDR